MHQIDLQADLEPDVILQNCKDKDIAWKNFRGKQKKQVKARLLQRQNFFCAYCEKSIDENTSHIDHIIRKVDDEALWYEWHNIVCSCQKVKVRDHCGHGKEQKFGTPAKVIESKGLLHPIFDNARDYIKFQHSGTSYEAVCVHPLNHPHTAKSQNSIAAYGLNHPALLNERARAIEKYADKIIAIQDTRTQPSLYSYLRQNLLNEVTEKEFTSCLQDYIKYELPQYAF